MRSSLVLCLALIVLGERDARADLKVTATTTPYPGVTHAVYEDPSVPLVVHLVTVDVTAQEIHLYATQSQERGQTVSDFANCKKAATGCVVSEVAVNGDLFAPLGFVPAGLAIGGAAAWSDAAKDNATEGYFAFGRPNDVNAVYLSSPATVEQPPAALAVEGAIGGRALLVAGGQPQSSYDAADPTGPFRSAPRTALGIDDPMAAHTLYLAVVDGDQASSAGMTAEELGDFLATIGASDAIELDGGGSSALFVRKEGGLVSSPSDGVERQVANHLGIHYGVSPYRASVVGKVFDSQFGNDAKTITDATVTVDGVLATWNTTAPAHTVYNVDNVQPHFVCAHASAPGFKSAQQCRQITASDIQASQIQYLSLVLYPGSDPPPDMAAPPDLAQPRSGPPDLAGRDGRQGMHGGTDAGLTDAGLPGGCSVSGRSREASHGLLAVVFLGAATLYIRRRKRVHD
jgi:hypothetical protein